VQTIRVGSRIYAFKRAMFPIAGTCVVISENTLQEMLSNLHEFLSELGTVVCFGR
jgi:hypothetical protein